VRRSFKIEGFDPALGGKPWSREHFVAYYSQRC
jgi:hypothetical protein